MFRGMNRLAREKSPYLLQHAHNPVDWHAWNEEAFARARAENKPIFLSVGYSTCHWCHVMERESFVDERIGKFLNEHFISIKVDREERPDVDKIYMTFVQATTGGGGWPMNVFLTPDLKPFFGGTYFPPDARHGRPSFLQLLQHLVQLWREQKNDIITSAARGPWGSMNAALRRPPDQACRSPSMRQYSSTRRPRAVYQRVRILRRPSTTSARVVASGRTRFRPVRVAASREASHWSTMRSAFGARTTGSLVP